MASLDGVVCSCARVHLIKVQIPSCCSLTMLQTRVHSSITCIKLDNILTQLSIMVLPAAISAMKSFRYTHAPSAAPCSWLHSNQSHPAQQAPALVTNSCMRANALSYRQEPAVLAVQHELSTQPCNFECTGAAGSKYTRGKMPGLDNACSQLRRPILQI